MSLGEYKYLNCYAMLEEIRTNLNEYSTGLMQASENGVFDNTDIVRKINSAQRFVFNILFNQMPELFLTSSSVSGSSGVYTIPSDCHRLDSIMDSDGVMIHPIDVKLKHLTSFAGSDYLYYRKGNTIVRDSSESSALTFNYYKAPKDLTQGMSSAGGALSLTLAATAKAIADYYNGITIENITDGWSDTISDYTSGRVATLAAQTGAASKYYGTVSELPDIFHPLIIKRATISLKSSTVSPQRAEVGEINDLREELIETMRSFAGTPKDVMVDELIFDSDVFL